MGYGRTNETIIGFDWINDGKWNTYIKSNNPCIRVKYEEMSFLREGCCPGCGEHLSEITQNNNIAAFDTIFTIGLNGEITTKNRPKPQQFCCGACGRPLSFITTIQELASFAQSLPKGAIC